MSRRNFLRTEQAEFDRIRFDQPGGWQAPNWEDQKTRHILLHINKATGKLLSGDEEVIKNEVCPDLAIYRTQLMTLHSVGRSMLGPNTKPIVSQYDWLRGLAEASSNLATYLEPAEHGSEIAGNLRPGSVFRAIGRLWGVHEGMAEHFGIDPEQSHRQRMEQILEGKK